MHGLLRATFDQHRIWLWYQVLHSYSRPIKWTKSTTNNTEYVPAPLQHQHLTSNDEYIQSFRWIMSWMHPCQQHLHHYVGPLKGNTTFSVQKEAFPKKKFIIYCSTCSDKIARHHLSWMLSLKLYFATFQGRLELIKKHNKRYIATKAIH